MFGLDDKEMVMLCGFVILSLQIVLAMIQFIYRMWDKKNTGIIIASNMSTTKEVIDAVNGVFTSISPHIERTKKTHEMVHQMQQQNGVQVDGLPLIYRNVKLEAAFIMNAENLKNSNETLKHVASIVEKMDSKLDTHKDTCKEQFGKVDKSLSQCISKT